MAPTKQQNQNEEPLLNHQEGGEIRQSSMPGVPMYLPSTIIPIPEMSFMKELNESSTHEPYSVPPPKMDYLSQWYPQPNSPPSNEVIHVLHDPSMIPVPPKETIVYSNQDGTVMYPIAPDHPNFRQPQQPQQQVAPRTRNDVENPSLDKASPELQLTFVRTVLTIVNIQMALLVLACYVIHVYPEIHAFLASNEILVIPVCAEGAAVLGLLLWCPDMGICSAFNMILFFTLSFSQTWIVATFAATTDLQTVTECCEIIFGFSLALWIYAGFVNKKFSHLGASLTIIMAASVLYALAMNYESEVSECFPCHMLVGIGWSVYLAHVIVSTVDCCSYRVKADNYATGAALVYTYLPVTLFSCLFKGCRRRQLTRGRIISV